LDQCNKERDLHHTLKMMTRDELASYIDHTYLKPEGGAQEIAVLCAEAANARFIAVCVAPRHVALAKKLLDKSPTHVATVAGFPNGDTFSRAKADETKLAIDNGADEVDMVIAIGAARDGDWNYVRHDIASVVKAAHGHAIIKVILENAYLTKDQIVQACLCAKDAGADYVKTSTGFASSGATIEDVHLMKQTVGNEMFVKAAGGIRDLKTALAMIDAGASRLGMSASLAILQEFDNLKPAA
jgi:deoxyribose-phosphate aldolase